MICSFLASSFWLIEAYRVWITRGVCICDYGLLRAAAKATELNGDKSQLWDLKIRNFFGSICWYLDYYYVAGYGLMFNESKRNRWTLKIMRCSLLRVCNIFVTRKGKHALKATVAPLIKKLYKGKKLRFGKKEPRFVRRLLLVDVTTNFLIGQLKCWSEMRLRSFE